MADDRGRTDGGGADGSTDPAEGAGARDATDPLTRARDHTPVLRSLAEEYGESRPFDGYVVAVATHLEPKSGVLIETLGVAVDDPTASRRAYDAEWRPEDGF